jgi:RNA polymerase sigma-70 factor (ECF subfamily)
MLQGVRACWETGRAAWPTVQLEEALFAEHVATKVGAPEEVERLDAAGLYLACACARGVPSALAAFDAQVLARVPEFLSRFQGGATLADDVGSVLRERLLVGAEGRPPRIATYAGDGPLAAWVRVAAVRAALNVLEKKEEPVARDEGARDRVPDGDDPERALASARQREVFREVLGEAVSALPAQQRTALRLHFADGLSGDEIGARLGVSRATVVRWLSAARGLLERETRRLLAGRLRLSGAEAESLIASARSRMDLSLSVLLASESG